MFQCLENNYGLLGSCFIHSERSTAMVTPVNMAVEVVHGQPGTLRIRENLG